jgi:hypothetical protein
LIDLILNWQSEGREKISVSEITDHFIERQKKKVTFQERENLKRRIKIALNKYAAIGKIKTSYHISKNCVTELIVIQ